MIAFFETVKRKIHLRALTCGSQSTLCTAVFPDWWKPSMGHSAHSRSRVHCLGGSAPLGGGSPRLPGPPCRPALLARWRSRCCWWRARLSGPDAARTGNLVRNNAPAWLSTGGHACASLPRCNSCRWCLCKQRQCSPGLPVSTPVAVSQTQPAACSSCRHTITECLQSYTATGWQRGHLTAHWKILGRPSLTLWGTPPQNRTSSHYLHTVWQNTISDLPRPQSENPAVAQLRVNIKQLWWHSCEFPSKATCVMVNQKYDCQWFNERTVPWASFGRPAGYFVLKTTAFNRKRDTLHITLYLTDFWIVFIFPIISFLSLKFYNFSFTCSRS